MRMTTTKMRTTNRHHHHHCKSNNNNNNNNDNHNHNDKNPNTPPTKPLDTILVVQHEPVYTLGTASDPSFLLHNNSDIPMANIQRGGEITYHGPGQVTLYPILNLQRNYVPDLHWYMRALEQVVIQAVRRLDDSLQPARQDDTTGVWLPAVVPAVGSSNDEDDNEDDNEQQQHQVQYEQAKVAAIGVHARRWITQHGLAVNVEDHCLPAFDNIVPCGLVGKRVTTLNACRRQRPASPNQNNNNNNNNNNKDELTVEEFVPYLLDAMRDVFQMELVLDDEGEDDVGSHS